MRTGFVPIEAMPFALPESMQDVLLTDGKSHVRLGTKEAPLVSVIAATCGQSNGVGWLETRPASEPAVGTKQELLDECTVEIYSKPPEARRRVSDVMSARVATIAAGTTLREAAKLIESTGASDLVVQDEEGSFVGVLSEGDLIRALMPRTDQTDADAILEAFERLLINGRARAGERIESLMIRHPIVLSPDDDLLRVAEIMVTRQIRRLPVVSANRAIGSVSRADLCRALLYD